MFRVVTIAREYGSGGGRIAQLLAGRLGWKLLDRCLVEKIAETARIEPQVAEKFDERPDPWFDRLAEVFWKSPGLRGYIGSPVPGRFDADVAAHLTHRIIEEAAADWRLCDCGAGKPMRSPAARRCFPRFHLRAPERKAGAIAPPRCATVQELKRKKNWSRKMPPALLTSAFISAKTGKIAIYTI